MNNNEIKNSKVDILNGKNLNDKDYINNLLSTLKELNKNYVIGLIEASNEHLYQEYKDMFLKYSKMQREVYELMFKKGWYTLEKADKNKINNKFQILNQELNDLK